MRLWSIHPSYLDARGLVALWREGLLAQKVLHGKTRGYKNHPQLQRFRNTCNPEGAIAEYLRSVVDEADARGYAFDRGRIINKKYKGKITITSGQVHYEYKHLLKKLRIRDPELFRRINSVTKIKLHPMFREISGDVEEWERV